MKKFYWFLLITFLSPTVNFLSAAWVVTYSMTPSVPGFTQIYGTAGNNVLAEPAACSDQITTAVTPIGFTFQFDGTNYTTWQLTDNGCLIFGGGAPTTCANPEFNSQIPNDLADNGTMYRPFLAPLWDELWFKPTSAFGQGSYKLSGSTPNQTLTIEWLFMSWKGTGAHTTDDISFQVVLHETSMVIDFIYKNDAGALNAPSASCGLGAIANATFYSLNNLTGAPAVSSAAATNTLAAKPSNNGQMYRWTPSTVLPVSLVAFSGYASGEENVLNWNVASQINNHYFTLFRTCDGNSYENIAQVNGAGTTSELLDYTATDNDPCPSITYYKLEWTDYNGITESSPLIAVSTSSKTPVYLFPDPASSIINIPLLKEQTSYFITDAQGRMIRNGVMEKDESVLDITGIDSGIYFLALGEKQYKMVIAHRQ
ncbi:MAG: T9SS type A sorting domain-containing protein [Bacteroidetes bacterium]|nr:T9SS type A sorting domain-containing protein [Bacteroidota bacterium]